MNRRSSSPSKAMAPICSNQGIAFCDGRFNSYSNSFLEFRFRELCLNRRSGYLSEIQMTEAANEFSLVKSIRNHFHSSENLHLVIVLQQFFFRGKDFGRGQVRGRNEVTIPRLSKQLKLAHSIGSIRTPKFLRSIKGQKLDGKRKATASHQKVCGLHVIR